MIDESLHAPFGSRFPAARQSGSMPLKGKLANFKVPRRVYVLDELPRNAMGRVKKNVLRERFVPGANRP